MNFAFVLSFVILFSTLFSEEPFSKTWILGGNLTVQFKSDAHFDYSQTDFVQMSAHLPGFSESNQNRPDLIIEHTQSGEFKFEQGNGKIKVASAWNQKLPPDFIHLLYGASRLQWLNQKIFPVHAACIGNDEDGYILLVGAPGSGKTSLTLYNAAKSNYKVFSGDKTLLRFSDDGKLEALAGTRTLTVRSEDVERWTTVPKLYEHQFGDRLAFQLPPAYYAKKQSVPIKQIYLIDINAGTNSGTQLSALSALHTLYPFFLDKQREDVLIEDSQGFLDGAVGKDIKTELSKNLFTALQNIPVYKVSASVPEMTDFIGRKFNDKVPKKILWGICGIGNGHYNRQLPVLRHFLDRGHRIMVFTYGEGLSFFKDKFPPHQNLTVVPVADPYFAGDSEGLDFKQTALTEKNKVDFNHINALAMFQAEKEFGRPDLVISDYEMVAAQYAYAKQAPLVTLDQQSKYLVGDFLQDLNGTSYIDEVERLNMFFPKAKKRIAVSFFTVRMDRGSNEIQVEILPPMIKPEIRAAKGRPLSSRPSLLVYVTAQQIGEQPIEEWISIIRSTLPDHFEAHIFLPQRLTLPRNDAHIYFYHHGDDRFDSLMIAAHGIVSTAGHTLLSEAMYLEKPVYALPLPLYEQQLSAWIIAQGGFGINEPTLSVSGLKTFIQNLDLYTSNIKNDRKLLLKEPGNDLIIESIAGVLEKRP